MDGLVPVSPFSRNSTRPLAPLSIVVVVRSYRGAEGSQADEERRPF